MDPVSIFGIIVNVATLIDLVGKVITIYKDGGGPDQAQLVESADELDSVCQQLQKRQISAQAGSVEADLQDCASRCIQTAAALRKELDLSAVQNSRRKRVAHSFKVHFSRKIPMLERELKDLHNELDTKLLVRIRESIDINATKQSDQFRSLDTSIQALFVQFCDRQNSAFDLVLDQNTRRILDHIDATAKKQIDEATGRDLQRRKNQILESLLYGNPFTRRNDILDKHDGTFEWIYDKDKGSTFPDWLRSPDAGDIFWIQGKPGAGKSTLMKFVTTSKARVKAYLIDAEPAKTPIVMSFYFWLADTLKMQNTEKGFLCSLLSQLLETQWTLDSSYLSDAILREKKTQANWDLSDLRSLVLDTAKALVKDHWPFIFVDALDECLDADLPRVLRFIKQLSEHGVKLCVSSRPEQRIVSSLRQSVVSILKIETFTKQDIKAFVKSELEEVDFDTANLSSSELENLTALVTRRAEGVFLWATLVSRDLRKGIENGDGFTLLQQRANKMPTDLNALYHNMLERLGPDRALYMAEAASYFSLMLHCTAHPGNWGFPQSDSAPLIFFIWIYTKLGRNAPIHQMSDLELILSRVEDRINAVCAGMLIFRVQEHSIDYRKPFPTLKSAAFIHRTARDFVLESGSEIIQSGLSLYDIHTSITSGVMVAVKICKSLNLHTVHDSVSLIEYLARSSLNPEQKGELMFHVDEFMARLYTKHWAYKECPDNSMDVLGTTIINAEDCFFNHVLSSGVPLSQRYKSYLLLLACTRARRLSNTIAALLRMRSDPNAEMYMVDQYNYPNHIRRRKTTPWLHFLEEWLWYEPRYNSKMVALAEAFLESGASLDTATIWLLEVDGKSGDIYFIGELMKTTKPIVILLHVNARFLLEHCYINSVSDVSPGAEESPTKPCHKVLGIFGYLSQEWTVHPSRFPRTISHFYPIDTATQPPATGGVEPPIQRVLDHILNCLTPRKRVDDMEWVSSIIYEYQKNTQREDLWEWALENGHVVRDDGPASMFPDYKVFQDSKGNIDLDALWAD